MTKESQMNTPNKIPEQIVNNAIEMIRHQPFVPQSPFDTDDCGGVHLCLAASLAAAGLEAMVSSDRVASFKDQLLQTQRVEVIDDAYEELGWGRAASLGHRERNDSFPDSDRKRFVLELLAGVA